MNTELVAVLQCPSCAGPLQAVEPARAPGPLRCGGCGQEFASREGILRFVEADDYAESFSHQWNRFEVQRHDEDAATFQTKTGVDARRLHGLRVLDGGCGGGRYAALLGKEGAKVIAVDLSRSVEKANELCHGMDNVAVLQADLLHLPVRTASMDFVFSIGVLHHSAAPREAFAQLAQRVRPGGLLAVWLYRRNTLLQEAINTGLRAMSTRMKTKSLERMCRAAAVAGAVPFLNRSLNKLVNFSNHPSWELRVCDNFDWYSPRYQSHHTAEEVRRWFEEEGFGDITELPPGKDGTLYRWAHSHNLIVGSGVNFAGVKA